MILNAKSIHINNLHTIRPITYLTLSDTGLRNTQTERASLVRGASCVRANNLFSPQGGEGRGRGAVVIVPVSHTTKPPKSRTIINYQRISG